MNTPCEIGIRTLLHRGQKVEVTVRIYCENDPETCVEDLSDDKNEQARLLTELNSGALTIGFIIVRASALGEEGLDSLGACLIGSPADIDSIVCDHDMIMNAVDDLMRNIDAAIERFKPFYNTTK